MSKVAQAAGLKGVAAAAGSLSRPADALARVA
jgi:hypothetical protein